MDLLAFLIFTYLYYIYTSFVATCQNLRPRKVVRSCRDFVKTSFTRALTPREGKLSLQFGKKIKLNLTNRFPMSEFYENLIQNIEKVILALHEP